MENTTFDLRKSADRKRFQDDLLGVLIDWQVKYTVNNKTVIHYRSVTIPEIEFCLAKRGVSIDRDKLHRQLLTMIGYKWVVARTLLGQRAYKITPMGIDRLCEALPF